MINNTMIPVPKSYVPGEGVLTLKPYISTAKAEWKDTVKAFCAWAAKIYEAEFTEGEGGIQIICDETVEKEAYIVEVDEEVVIRVSDLQGCAYALATLIQIMNKKLEVPKVKIEDKPDKDYRGLMVDLAREWHPFRTVLNYVDLCFFYKVKYLHLHFMDDQSYTLPSNVYPKLPTRNRSYTMEEIAQLCAYAKERGVVIVPEIEMPGHAKSLIAAYPELFANQFDEKQEETTLSEAGALITRESVICAGSEVTFEALKKLIDEVLEMFKDFPYIHLGADEVKTDAWNQCPVCREYMEKNSMKDAQELYGDFVGRATSYVLSKGKRPIVWEGVAKEYNHKLSKDVLVIGWECHYQNPDDLLEYGFEIINCAWKPLYIVPSRITGRANGWNEFDILKWNVYEWQHWWSESAATLNPFHIPPTDQVLGAQLCAWEMTYECEIAAIVVRLAALSERTWAVKRSCTDDEFFKKLRVQMDKAFAFLQ